MLKAVTNLVNVSQIVGVLPVVNGGTGVTTSTGTGNTVLSAAPTLSGNVSLSTGNLVIGTSGKGIDFSITSSGSGTMTSELLADYEEGTWTPTDTSGAGLTLTVTNAKYTKIGCQVTLSAYIAYPANGSAAIASISLPFASTPFVLDMCNASTGNVSSIVITGGSSNATFRNVAVAALANLNLSGADILFTLTYMV